MKRIFKILIVFIGFPLMLSSCLNDLNVTPIDENDITSATVYNDPAAYRQVLAKLYAGLAISGQEGPAGRPDISGIDEGFGQYVRGFFNHQVLTTDEAVIGWDDQTIKDLVYHAWGSSDVFITAMYSRIFYQISLANEYLRQTSDERLNDRNVAADLRERIQTYRAEARFLRALSYWHALDLFGNVPFVTENEGIGATPPQQISRTDLFSWIEGELLDVEPAMVNPPHPEYGRADKGAARMLLAKLYLNAEVYTGNPRWSDALTWSERVINEGGYSLESNYQWLFNADNNRVQNPSLNEIIFAVRYHGINTQTFGGTTFLIKAALGGDLINALDYGVDDKWGGLRTTRNLFNLFSAGDSRALFFTEGQNVEINNLSEYTDGIAVVKFTNVRRNGQPGSSISFADTDFPMFRLADAYLMYAEAHLRGGGGSASQALDYFNALRQRAFGNASQNVTNLTLDLILSERARELYWEGHRRTDLIRFGRFTGGQYLWPWKNNVREGGATDARYNLFPIPQADMTANPNLTQNPGYN
jgi:starch-binding outer membrane protein, SusD/RagB family